MELKVLVLFCQSLFVCRLYHFYLNFAQISNEFDLNNYLHENMRMIHEICIKNCTIFMRISYRHICMIFALETFYLVYTRFVYDFHTKRKSHENHASLPCKYMSKTNFLKYAMLTKQKKQL